MKNADPTEWASHADAWVDAVRHQALWMLARLRRTQFGSALILMACGFALVTAGHLFFAILARTKYVPGLACTICSNEPMGIVCRSLFSAGSCPHSWNIGGKSCYDDLCAPPIDVVYTWVNGSDPILIKMIARFRNEGSLLLFINYTLTDNRFSC